MSDALIIWRGQRGDVKPRLVSWAYEAHSTDTEKERAAAKILITWLGALIVALVAAVFAVLFHPYAAFASAAVLAAGAFCLYRGKRMFGISKAPEIDGQH